MNAITILQPPTLDIDSKLYPDGKIHARGRIERRVVWNCLKYLEAAGHYPILHCDGEEDVKVKGDLKQCMELTFNLDECRIIFAKSPNAKWTDRTGSIVVVLGNDGWDSIADWTWREDGDEFDKAMGAFDAEAYA